MKERIATRAAATCRARLRAVSRGLDGDEAQVLTGELLREQEKSRAMAATSGGAAECVVQRVDRHEVTCALVTAETIIQGSFEATGNSSGELQRGHKWSAESA
jgi:hypothetical protein